MTSKFYCRGSAHHSVSVLSTPLESLLSWQGLRVHSPIDIAHVPETCDLRCSRHHDDSSIVALQLAAVALRLAQSWGDAAAVRTAPVRQQAYLTAALVEAVGRLGAGPLENFPGLLPALLAGVSTRLESPLPPVRSEGLSLKSGLGIGFRRGYGQKGA